VTFAINTSLPPLYLAPRGRSMAKTIIPIFIFAILIIYGFLVNGGKNAVLSFIIAALKGSFNRLETMPHEAEVTSSNPPSCVDMSKKQKKKLHYCACYIKSCFLLIIVRILTKYMINQPFFYMFNLLG
jgi:hypothetical protein